MSTPPETRLILNADDFGLDADYNAIVVRCFAEGAISSATLMANMPFFAEACELAKAHGFDRQLGLHFNLTYGRPLGSAIRTISTICNTAGEFDFCLPRHRLGLPSAIRTAIRDELEHQWQACVEQGVRPSHIDSHQHVHNMLPIAGIVADFAATQGVPVRLARNLGKNVNLPKTLFKWLVNNRIRRSAQTTAYACTPLDLLHGLRPQGLVEVVCHPLILADGRIGDDYLPADTSLEDVLQAAWPGTPRVDFRQL